MAISHLAKIIVFGVLGFRFFEYIPLLIAMGSAAILGSYLGTHARQKIDNRRYLKVVKLLLSLLAMRMILLM